MYHKSEILKNAVSERWCSDSKCAGQPRSYCTTVNFYLYLPGGKCMRHVYEACMLCMGSVRNHVIDTVKTGSVQFDDS